MFKWYNDQKIISFFPSNFESVFAQHLPGKVLSFEFYPKAVYFERNFGFHGWPLLTLKTNRLDLRGLDLEKMTLIFIENDDTFETKFTRHVSVVPRPSSVESRINLELHLNL